MDQITEFERIEKGEIEMEAENNLITRYKVNIGIIDINYGIGRINVIKSIIAGCGNKWKNPEKNYEVMKIRTGNANYEYTMYKKKIKLAKTLILVDSLVMQDWIEGLENEEDVYFIKTRGNLKKFDIQKENKIIVCNTKLHNEIEKITEDYCWKRIVIDNAYSVNKKIEKIIDGRFYWIIKDSNSTGMIEYNTLIDNCQEEVKENIIYKNIEPEIEINEIYNEYRRKKTKTVDLVQLLEEKRIGKIIEVVGGEKKIKEEEEEEEEEMCIICFEKKKKKIVHKDCKNSCCGFCLLKWLIEQKSECPFCKKAIEGHNLEYHKDPREEKKKYKGEMLNDMIEREKKVIIYVKEKIKELELHLKMSNINYRKLTGSGAVNKKKIELFNIDSEISVIIIEEKNNVGMKIKKEGDIKNLIIYDNIEEKDKTRLIRTVVGENNRCITINIFKN